MKELDEKCLAKLSTHWKRHAAFPSMGKLCETLGLSSTSAVFALVGRLVGAGYLEHVEGRVAPTRKFFARPLLSAVRADMSQPDSQEQPELLSIDDYLVDEPNRTSLHKVRGDSMKDAGILDGDLVVVEHNTPDQARRHRHRLGRQRVDHQDPRAQHHWGLLPRTGQFCAPHQCWAS